MTTTKKNKPHTRKVPLSEIKTHPSLQNRVETELDVGHVDELVTSIKASGLKDPLIVFDVGGVFFLVSGHHRYEALKRINEEDRRASRSARALVYSGTMSDAVEFAHGRNLKPTKALNARERAQAAYTAMLRSETPRFRTACKRKVGPELGVSPGTIHNMRAALSELCQRTYRDTDYWKKHPDKVSATFPRWWQVRLAFGRQGEPRQRTMTQSLKLTAQHEAEQFEQKENPHDYLGETFRLEARLRILRKHLKEATENAKNLEQLWAGNPDF